MSEIGVSQSVLHSGLVLALCFVAGLSVTLLYNNRSVVLELTMDAYATRYRVMAGENQDHERYYVYHEGSANLTDFGQGDATVLDVQSTIFSSLTVVDLMPDSPSTLARLRQHPEVSLVIRSNLPIFCH